MLRLALRLLLVSVVLCAVGWLSLAHWAFEVVRVAGVGCLALGIVLLVLDYVRTPDPSGR
jgi:hypothetical protein